MGRRFESCRAHHSEVPRLRSGFRLAARTPRKRLKFESCRAHHSEVPRCARDFACRLPLRSRLQTGSSSSPAALTTVRSLDYARDFGSRLGRRENASSSSPAALTNLSPAALTNSSPATLTNLSPAALTMPVWQAGKRTILRYESVQARRQ